MNTPKAGDIIVLRQVHSPAVYILSVHDGPPQIAFRTHEEALEKARRFAQQARLDVWYTTDGDAFERVGQHRPSRRK